MFEKFIHKYNEFCSNLRNKWDNFKVSKGITTWKKIYKNKEIDAVDNALIVILFKNPKRFGSPVIYFSNTEKIWCWVKNDFVDYHVFTKKTWDAIQEIDKKEGYIWALYPHTDENIEIFLKEKRNFARLIIITTKYSNEDGFEGETVVDTYEKHLFYRSKKK